MKDGSDQTRSIENPGRIGIRQRLEVVRRREADQAVHVPIVFPDRDLAVDDLMYRDESQYTSFPELNVQVSECSYITSVPLDSSTPSWFS